MCDVNGQFKLCTCSELVKHNKLVYTQLNHNHEKRYVLYLNAHRIGSNLLLVCTAPRMQLSPSLRTYFKSNYTKRIWSHFQLI